MRNRSSKNMEVEREEQPHLSGAYIRSLVKQLSHSSRSKGGNDSTMKSPENENGDQNPKNSNTTKATQDHAKNSVSEGGKEENKVPQPYKKQVRRRLHTTRPYQERLLNMAEARREIVTALKIHRASMKQAKEKQQQQQEKQHQMQLQQQLLQQPQTLIPPSTNDPLFQPYREYPFNYSTFSNYLCNTEVSPFAYSSFSWPQPTIAPTEPLFSNFNLDLPFPSQPLGLNLNFQGFNSIDFPLPSQSVGFNKPIPQPSPTSSSSHSYSSPTPQIYEEPKLLQNENYVPLHPVMDEVEIAEIYSLGEKHDIEWNDTVNLVTSAWWSKFLKNLEEGEGKENMEGIESHAEEGMEGIERQGSDVLNGGNLHKPLLLHESFGQENSGGFFDDQIQHFGCYQVEYSEEVALPRLDIGEIEGWDVEWLS